MLSFAGSFKSAKQKHRALSTTNHDEVVGETTVAALEGMVRAFQRREKSGSFNDTFEEMQMILFNDVDMAPEEFEKRQAPMIGLRDLLVVLPCQGDSTMDVLTVKMLEAIKRFAAYAVQISILPDRPTPFLTDNFQAVDVLRQSMESRLQEVCSKPKNSELPSVTPLNPLDNFVLQDKALYNAEVILKLIGGNADMTAACSKHPTTDFAELLAKLGEVAVGNRQSTAWLIGRGIKQTMQIASAVKKNLPVQLLVVEQFTSLIHFNDSEIGVEHAMNWIRDCSSFLSDRFRLGLRYHKDWLVIYGVIDCILNLALRFPQVQQEALVEFRKQREYKIKNTANLAMVVAETVRDSSEFKRRIRFKFLEALAELAHWGEPCVQTEAVAALEEHRWMRLQKSAATDRHDHLLKGLLEVPSTEYGSLLSFPAVADFLSIETCRQAIVALFSQECLTAAQQTWLVIKQAMQRGQEGVTSEELWDIALPHLPQVVIQTLESCRAVRAGVDLVTVRRLFVRIFVLALSTSTRTIAVPPSLAPHHSGAQRPNQPLHTQSAHVQREDMVAVASSDDVRVQQEGSSAGPSSNPLWEQGPPPAVVPAAEVTAVQESVKKIRQHIEDGAASADDSTKSRHHVVVIGMTGSGKSTAVNALARCDFRTFTTEEAIKHCVIPDAVMVRPVSEGGAKDAVTDVGYSFLSSQTEVLRSFEISGEGEKGGFLVWDAPGFEDAHGSEINIANAVNLTRLFQSSHQNGLVIMVVLDAPSLQSVKASSIKDTMRILNHMFAHGGSLNASMLSSILFCVTKASDAARLPAELLRGWVVGAAANEGLQVRNEQIAIFDPLSRHSEGIGPDQLREQLATMPPFREDSSLYEAPLTAEDKVLIERMSFVLCRDATASLQRGDFDQIKGHILVFRSLSIVAHQLVAHHNDVVVRCVWDSIKNCATVLHSKVRSLKAEDCALKNHLLIMVQKAQILDDVLPAVFSVQKLYAEAYQTMRDAEKEMQDQEEQYVNTAFTNAKADLRSALKKLSISNPDFFSDFSDCWTTNECLHKYSSMKEVHYLQRVQQEALSLRARRAPGQVYVFGEQGDLASAIQVHDDQVRTIFQEAWHKSRGTLLERAFGETFAKLQDSLEKALRTEADDDVRFLSARVVPVAEIDSLVGTGQCSAAQDLHTIVEALRSEYQEEFERAERELEVWLRDIHQRAVDIKVGKLAVEIKQQQDSFVKVIEEDIEQWAQRIKADGDDLLRAELKLRHGTHTLLWEEVSKHEDLASVSTTKRDLEARECTLFDSLTLLASNTLEQRAAALKQAEMETRGKLEQLQNQSFEVIKRDFARLSAQSVSLGDLQASGFERGLVSGVHELLERIPAIDTALSEAFSKQLDTFFDQLQQRAVAEKAAATLCQSFAAFEQTLRGDLQRRAELIVAGKEVLRDELVRTTSNYHVLWETVRARKELPGVIDTMNATKRTENETVKRMQLEADQFLKQLASDRKQRDAKFEQLLVELRKEMEAVVRADPNKVATAKISGSAISQVAHLGFNAAHVSELSALMTFLQHRDPSVYQERALQLDQFCSEMQEMATVVGEAEAFRKALRSFADHVRGDMYTKAPILKDGGKQKLEKELELHAADQAPWLERLSAGQLPDVPLVRAVLSELAGEKESLLSQLQRDVSNYLSNLVSDRKQVQQQFSAALLRLQESAKVIDSHCEALSGACLAPNDIRRLRQYGFDQNTVNDVERLLQHIRAHDKDMYQDRVADLQEALQCIRRAAADRWVEKLRAKALHLLGVEKDRLLARIQGVASAMVHGSVDVNKELVTRAIAECMSAIASCPTDRSKAVFKEVKAEIQRTCDEITKLAKERAELLAREQKTRAREAISNRIMQLLPELPKHQQPDQRELKKALDELRALDGSAEQYQQALAAVQAQLERMTSTVEIQQLVGSNDFNCLAGRAQTMRSLERLLAKHLHLSSKRVVVAVQQQMDELIAEVEVELRADIGSDSYLQFTKLRHFCSVFVSLTRCFQGLGSDYDLDSMMEKMKQSAFHHLINMMQNLQKMVTESEELSLDLQRSVAKLLIKGFGMSHELRFDGGRFKSVVEMHVISKCSPQSKYEIGYALSEYRNNHPSDDDGVKEMANIIINTFAAFKDWQVELFDKVAGFVTFDTALQQLRCVPQNESNGMLLEAYEGYYKVYETLVNYIVKDNSSFPLDETKGRILTLARELKACAMQLGQNVRGFGELLGLVCGLWSSLSCDSGSRREKRFVKQPRPTQILGIFRLLGLDQTQLCNHLIQIDTGEGKSIALGFTATVLALLGFRVDVVCYSRYLSERDFQAFHHLFQFFEVERQVSYSDFEQLSSRIMKGGSHEFPDMRQVYLNFLQQKKYTHTPSKTGPSVLLMDEVDVFFSDCFYGRTYNPSAELRHEACFSLIQFVWEHRSTLRDCSQHISMLLKRPETAALQQTYRKLSRALLEVEYRKLLQAVRLFPVAGSPKLKGMHPYVVDSRNGRIGYTDPVSGVPNYEWSYGYITAFTYLYCVSQNQLQLHDVQQHMSIQPVCGSLLYSRIPTFYTVCLGMTGTLDCLSSVQQALLKKFGFHSQTFLPSTFQRQRLNVDETVVETGSWNEYFETIKAEIEAKLDVGRASLVVFEDQLKLARFARELQKRPSTMKQCRGAKELTDSLSSADRDHMVIGAVRKYAITLMTRPYGRGTDFVCNDEGLVKNGGVHIVVTFYPSDDSENKQINGRTCRQNNPGSARKILFEEHLQGIAATEQEKERTGLDWDQYLARCRTAKEVERYQAMEESELENSKNHQDTLEAYELVKRGKWDAAADLFARFAQPSTVSQSTRGSYHLVLVLDQSGSMSGQKWQDLVGAVNALVSKRQSFGTQDLISIVIFSNAAEIGCEQVDVNQSPQACLHKSHMYGGTSFSAGLGRALEVLRRGRASGLPQSLLFMSDGASCDGDSEMQVIAQEFQGGELVVNTLAFGSNANSQKLERLAQLGGGTLLTAVDGAELKEEFCQVAYRLGHLDR